MRIQQLFPFQQMVFGGLGLTQHRLLIASIFMINYAIIKVMKNQYNNILYYILECKLTLADNSASLDDRCGSTLDISINDPYPGSNVTQFKIYVWAYKTKTSPTSIGSNFPALVSFCTNLPCNSANDSSSNQFYYVMAIKNFNSASTKVNFAVPWDIECNNTSPNPPPPNPPENPKPSSSSSEKIRNIDIINIYILTIIVTIIELRKLVA
ncbi:356_t:CDS:1 [Cetraspora pellucida]|uniref:356_t:CDS:1 n=1 Tax=Cetraspora pellucida TaxID=1433469 RepID=A0ACA9MXQ0_9GLOM|nr:356_t:CDS:1 [Cetraspora pellucida]